MSGRLWSVRELAADWRQKPDTVYRWIIRGYLQSRKIGSRHYVSQAEKDRFDREHTTA